MSRSSRATDQFNNDIYLRVPQYLVPVGGSQHTRMKRRQRFVLERASAYRVDPESKSEFLLDLPAIFCQNLQRSASHISQTNNGDPDFHSGITSASNPKDNVWHMITAVCR